MTTAIVINGLSTQGIQDMVEMVKAQPAVAQAVFSASTEWKSGFSSIRATYYVRSGAPRDQLEQVAKMAEDLSPTRHSLRAVEFTSRLEVSGASVTRSVTETAR